jgi:hypothetical protein
VCQRELMFSASAAADQWRRSCAWAHVCSVKVLSLQGACLAFQRFLNMLPVPVGPLPRCSPLS